MNHEAIRAKSIRYGIGLMSGSSCDGVDAALVSVSGTYETLHAELIAFVTVPYSDEMRERLLAASWNERDICALDGDLGLCLAGAAKQVLATARANGFSSEPDYVASHGHTLAHIPPTTARPNGSTLQIGAAAVIAERMGLTVVSNFRPRDMAAGGQGAPLVPYVDWLLFRRPDTAVACLNIGGIANVTVVTPQIDGVFAFDTGPGNMPIDGVVRWITHGAKHYDEGGQMSAQGVIHNDLVTSLLSHSYFKIPPPKSTGREDFEASVFLRDFESSLRAMSANDAIATVTEVVARSIADACTRHINTPNALNDLIVSGGGIHNQTLMARLQSLLPQISVSTTDKHGLSGDAKEAFAFAILGNETLFGTASNVPSATGARKRVVLGDITPA